MLFAASSFKAVAISCLAALTVVALARPAHSSQSAQVVVSAFKDVCVPLANSPTEVKEYANSHGWLALDDKSTKRMLRGASGYVWFIPTNEKNRILFIYRLTGSCGVEYDEIDPVSVNELLASQMKLKEISRDVKQGRSETSQHAVTVQGQIAGLLHNTTFLQQSALKGWLNFIEVGVLEAAGMTETLRRMRGE